MPGCNLQEQERELEEGQRVMQKKQFLNYCFFVIYIRMSLNAWKKKFKSFGLTRTTFYSCAKILDNHTDNEIKFMEIKR